MYRNGGFGNFLRFLHAQFMKVVFKGFPMYYFTQEAFWRIPGEMSLEDLRDIEAGLTLDENDQPVFADKIKIKQTSSTRVSKRAKKKKVKKTKKKSKFEDLLKQMAEKRKQNKEEGRLSRRERKRSALSLCWMLWKM